MRVTNGEFHQGAARLSRNNEMIQLLGSNQRAVEYLRASLNQSNSLARRGSDKLPWTEGRISIVAGSKNGTPSFSNFKFGGVASASESKVELAQILQKMLSIPEKLLVLEDSLARAIDHKRVEPPARLKTVGEEVYILLQSGRYSWDCIEKILRVPRFYNAQVGFLCHAPASVIQQDWTDIQISELVENISTVFVGAFDGEGFLLWQR